MNKNDLKQLTRKKVVQQKEQLGKKNRKETLEILETWSKRSAEAASTLFMERLVVRDMAYCSPFLTNMVKLRQFRCMKVENWSSQCWGCSLKEMNTTHLCTSWCEIPGFQFSTIFIWFWWLGIIITTMYLTCTLWQLSATVHNWACGTRHSIGTLCILNLA